MTHALRIDELEAIIARILGLEAQYEVRICRRKPALGRRLAREVANDLMVRWQDVAFAKVRTAGDLRRAIRRRYGYDCLILNAEKRVVAARTRINALAVQVPAPPNLVKRLWLAAFAK